MPRSSSHFLVHRAFARSDGELHEGLENSSSDFRVVFFGALQVNRFVTAVTRKSSRVDSATRKTFPVF
jgi:hypothetical protein